jgi:hypothetical protein
LPMPKPKAGGRTRREPPRKSRASVLQPPVPPIPKVSAVHPLPVPVPATPPPPRGPFQAVLLAHGPASTGLTHQEAVGTYRVEHIIDEAGKHIIRRPGVAGDGTDDLYRDMSAVEVQWFKRAKRHPARIATATGYFKKCGSCGMEASANPNAGGGNCAKCKMQYYCSKECQKKDRHDHEPNYNSRP